MEATEKLDPEELIRHAIATRGDMFPEFSILAHTIPEAYAINQQMDTPSFYVEVFGVTLNQIIQ